MASKFVRIEHIWCILYNVFWANRGSLSTVVAEISESICWLGGVSSHKEEEEDEANQKFYKKLAVPANFVLPVLWWFDNC